MALCIEAGKPIKDARGEVTRLIDTFRIAAGEATRIDGEVLELRDLHRAPAATAAWSSACRSACARFITPFNFPLNLVAHKVAPAIAAGCPFVLKPAAKTPIGALIIGEVLAETDLPKGAFSILPCSKRRRRALVEDERIELLSFTGGLVGWDLKARAGHKKVVLELGGNAACIVDADPGRPRRCGRAPGLRRVLPVRAELHQRAAHPMSTTPFTTSCANAWWRDRSKLRRPATRKTRTSSSAR